MAVVVVDGGGGTQGGHDIGVLAASVTRIASRVDMAMTFMPMAEVAGILLAARMLL